MVNKWNLSTPEIGSIKTEDNSKKNSFSENTNKEAPKQNYFDFGQNFTTKSPVTTSIQSDTKEYSFGKSSTPVSSIISSISLNSYSDTLLKSTTGTRVNSVQPANDEYSVDIPSSSNKTKATINNSSSKDSSIPTQCITEDDKLNKEEYFSENAQLLQLRAQMMAYRILARHQPLPSQIFMAVSGGPQRPASSKSSTNK